MTGLFLFNEEVKKRGYSISVVDTSRGDSNGDFIISSSVGKTTKQNYKRIAEIYGTLTFYHYEPEEAIDQIFELIELSIDNPNINY